MEGWEEALAYFCTEAIGHNIDFYLIGSVSASVRGVAITPEDID